MSEEARPLRVETAGAIARVIVDHPPMNLLGAPLMGALFELVERFEKDEDARVIVLSSADPDFFIAHGDVETIVAVPNDPVPLATELPFTHQLLERWRRLPQVTIAKIEGFARGGGSEVTLACDMRFGAIGRAVFGQPETALGILPGAGGTARLTRLVGRARAAEIILSGDDFTAEEAEHYGWINRALPADEIGPFVDRLAQRIASYPAHTLRETKRVIHTIAEPDIERDLLLEQQTFDALMTDPRAERIPRMQRFLDRHVQTRDGERGLAEACTTLGED